MEKKISVTQSRRQPERRKKRQQQSGSIASRLPLTTELAGRTRKSFKAACQTDRAVPSRNRISNLLPRATARPASATGYRRSAALTATAVGGRMGCAPDYTPSPTDRITIDGLSSRHPFTLAASLPLQPWRFPGEKRGTTSPSTRSCAPRQSGCVEDNCLQ